MHQEQLQHAQAGSAPISPSSRRGRRSRGGRSHGGRRWQSAENSSTPTPTTRSRFYGTADCGSGVGASTDAAAPGQAASTMMTTTTRCRTGRRTGRGCRTSSRRCRCVANAGGAPASVAVPTAAC